MTSKTLHSLGNLHQCGQVLKVGTGKLHMRNYTNKWVWLGRMRKDPWRLLFGYCFFFYVIFWLLSFFSFHSNNFFSLKQK